jgi:hypothetical protein
MDVSTKGQKSDHLKCPARKNKAKEVAETSKFNAKAVERIPSGARPSRAINAR